MLHQAHKMPSFLILGILKQQSWGLCPDFALHHVHMDFGSYFGAEFVWGLRYGSCWHTLRPGPKPMCTSFTSISFLYTDYLCTSNTL